MKNDDHRWYVEHWHGIFVWKRHRWRTMIIDGMLNIKDTVFISIKHKIQNDNHRSSPEHKGHGFYLCKTKTWRTMIIDDMSNIMYPVFMSRIHKHEEWWSWIMCRTSRTRYIYFWKKQILTSIIIDDGSKNNKRFSLFHAHFFLPCSIFCACLFPVSLSFYFIVAVLMRRCWDNIRTWVPHSYSHTECYLFL